MGIRPHTRTITGRHASLYLRTGMGLLEDVSLKFLNTETWPGIKIFDMYERTKGLEDAMIVTKFWVLFMTFSKYTLPQKHWCENI